MSRKRWLGVSVFAVLFVVGATLGASAFAKSKSKPKKANQGFSFGMGMSEGSLGANVQPMTEELRAYFGAPKDKGILVAGVDDDSAAARMGLKAGDVITEVDGEACEEMWDVATHVADKDKGDEVKLTVVRDKKTITVSSKLTEDDLDTFGGVAFGSGGAHVYMAGPNVRGLQKLHRLGAGSFDIQVGGFDDDDADAMRERMEKLEQRLDKLEKKVK